MAADEAPTSAHRDTAPDEDNVALAWRILSSPRTFLALTALLALVLALGAALPQAPQASELARRLPFASADAATGLGLTDVLVGWPTLLLLLLLALNGAGLIIARVMARGAPRGAGIAQADTIVHVPIERLRARIAEGKVAPLARLPLRVHGAVTSGRRGLSREAPVLVAFGLVALAIGLGVARGTALDARLSVAPGTGALSEAVVRDGDLFLPKLVPYGLTCQRPDPQDPRRAFDCRLAGASGADPVQVSLAPGYSSKVGDLELSPLAESARPYAAGESYDLVLARGGAAPSGGGPGSAIERLRIDPGKTIELRASGERLTAYPGPDGPLLVLEAKDRAPVLLAPATTPTAFDDLAAPGLRIAAEPATRLTVAATSAPERWLVLVGTVLVALGLILLGLVPHLELTLAPAGDGTRVTLWSTNRPDLPHAILDELQVATLDLGLTAPPRRETGA